MHSLLFSLLFTSLSLLHPSTALPPHRPPPSIATNSLSSSIHAPPVPHPTVFFEVTKPTPPPSTTTTTAPCSHHLLSHDFAHTYSQPPVTALYSPPSHCPFTRYSSVVLEFTSTCKGRQFDRIFGVWLNGVELLRSCSAEPTREGIFWKVRKDITKYYSLLLQSNQTIAIYLGNVVDKTYTGVYHVNLTFHYYPIENHGGKNHRKLGNLYENFADLILPISRNLPLNDGLWFEVENSSDVESKSVSIPRNAYRAVLEVYVSFHENDEFWYTNLPNDYLVANNMSNQQPGNGAFREVLVSLDGELVGSVWPFTVIFTGGINPLVWRPISAIGSFNLPSYDIEITPFLGKLLDGKPHDISFSVTNSLNVWYIDANLHLWLDNKVEVVKGQLLENNVESLTLWTKSHFKGLNGKFYAGASRSIMSKGWVESSKGYMTTISIQKFDFENYNVLRNDGSLQTVNQTIDLNTTVLTKLYKGFACPFYKTESLKKFGLFVYTNQVDEGNNSYSLLSNVTLGLNEDKIFATESVVSSSMLRNRQRGEGTMVVKNNLVSSGLGSTHQVYDYNENKGGFCYFRNVSSHNYTIVFDQVTDKCKVNTLLSNVFSFD
ncbi:peptide-N4-(N-acetyl-beta-glucosaminyl)asparagine amidase A isoform X1 [Spinacia oleracea]|uniref:Peptide-N4-(N-acetyl-beta- glucosaminyl)asparagine amidase A isoform X1 n=1 Tax=Spinacia oleracea TaxID=3562 RepID=A0A9R0IWE6_SPIOL|nr:peptide-N4-(N-acetyl-beta-glucosaminyl)asparagine amidase A isoform X1 [Spinacia oleracea]